MVDKALWPDSASRAVSQRSHGGGEFHRIFVPVNGSDSAVDAVALAARLCVATSGELRVVHVRLFDPPMRTSGRFYPESSEQATSVLERAVATAWTWGSKASGEIIDAPRSRVAASIAAAARLWNAELVVLFRRDRPAVARFMLGSVANQVMRRVTCPVLVVRPGQS
jgi:nucleotide-binding universal stress UspA family protein